MAIIKCKMCGGDMELLPDSTVCECEYCGSLQTVPNDTNEKKLNLFARANRLRTACEFDKAAGVFESIVAEFPDEAEAYWGLVLCRYGIEYVDDPATGRKIPTCHRSSYDSVLEDTDFEMAQEYADVVARRVYREEAKQIEQLRRGIVEVSAGERSYDIFICYKETGRDGGRTLDSVLAQDIYDALTDKGYRVFFSRITLEDKLGVEYEPYIFAALHSARIMLVVGTDYEYFNAVWVKNEWSRFLKQMASDRGKYLIPCYKGVDAYDMPKEFAKLQAQDLGKIGAMQDLLRGIEKLLPRKAPDFEQAGEITRQTVVVQSGGTVGSVENYLKRMEMCLADGDMTGADQFCEQVLNLDAENARAYLGKLCVQCKARSTEEVLAQKFSKDRRAPYEEKIFEDPLFLRAYGFADAVLKRKLDGYRTLRKENYEKQKVAWIQEQYDAAVKNREKGHFGRAAMLFSELGAFSDAPARAEECRRLDQACLAEARAQTFYRLQRVAPMKNAVSIGTGLTLGIHMSGAVLAVGQRSNSYPLHQWSGIVAAAVGDSFVLGLMSDGRVVHAGTLLHDVQKPDYQPQAPSPDEILSSIGKMLGTLTSSQLSGPERWTGMKGLAAGKGFAVGLRWNGTVALARTSFGSGWDAVLGWQGIRTLCVGGNNVYGLREDGVVLVAHGPGANAAREMEFVQGWREIVDLAAGANVVAGLRADGTVLVAFDDQMLQMEWRNIVSVAVGAQHVVGLRVDGAVESVLIPVKKRDAAGRSLQTSKPEKPEDHGQCDVGSWENIVAIFAAEDFTLGLRADGTTLCTQKDTFLTKWRLFESFQTLGADIARIRQANIQQQNLQARQQALWQQRCALHQELGNLNGLFSGNRRSQIEQQLQAIDAELNSYRNR